MLEFVVSTNGLGERGTDDDGDMRLGTPDFFTYDFVCVLRGKEETFRQHVRFAEKRLVAKTLWDYGHDAPYVCGYAAGASVLYLYALHRGSADADTNAQVEPLQLGSFDLSSASDRFELLLALLNLARLMPAIVILYPEDTSSPHEFATTELHSDGSFTRIDPKHIERVMRDNAAFLALKQQLSEVYDVLECHNVPNVVRLVGWKTRSVVLEPRGVGLLPCSNVELVGALKSVLHAASWMHHDIRWKNVMQRRPNGALPGKPE